jgi:predicted cupin superfamily sugar epimerase
MMAMDWIRRLGLAPHPEGGCFREIYRSAEIIPLQGLPERFAGPRSFSTSIYFLLEGKECSRFHRLKADEIWHFYTGSPLTIHLISPEGGYGTLALGPDIEKGEHFQAILPAGHWFGASVDHVESFALIGCTLAPGFDFQDFEIAQRVSLTRAFPQHEEIIRRLTL